MSAGPVFTPRLLVGWTAGAIAVFVASLYFMGVGGESSGDDDVGPSTFSRSAIGHAGFAELLTELGIPVVKSRYDSIGKLATGSVLVIAEPRPGRQTEQDIRGLLKVDRALLVLPKWTGQPSERKAGWLRDVRERGLGDARWTLGLVAPRAEVVRVGGEARWTLNELGPQPNPASPIQLIRGSSLRPIVASGSDIVLGELREGDRRLWVLSDPDVISNHGLARDGNAAAAVAMIRRLRSGDGGVVFDETVHGHVAKPANPLALLFRFPLVTVTVQGLLAIALLLWATMGRFGPPQPRPATLRAGRGSLLANMAELVEATGHQTVMVTRYVREAVRDVARQLHAPGALSPAAQLAWLGRVGKSRGADLDCETLVRRAELIEATGRGDARRLVRLARDTYRWRREVLDGRASHPHDH